MDGIQEFLRREATQALEKWKTAERFLEQTSDPQLMDFAIYSAEAAKQKYLYILRILRQREEEDEADGGLTVL